MLPHRCRLPCIPLAALAAASLAHAQLPDELGFASDVQPFLAEYCVKCHGPDKTKADFRADHLATISTNAMASHWQDVSDVLALGDMPPEEEDARPSAAEVEQVNDWIQAELARAKKALAATTREVVLRRLTNREYDLTLRDLLGINLEEFSPSLSLPAELERPGFTSNGATAVLTPSDLEAYLKASEAVLDHVVRPGARPQLFSRQWQASAELFPRSQVDPDRPHAVYLEHVFKRADLPASEFEAHFDGLYRVTVRAFGVPPAMLKPGPRRFPVEMSIRRHRPSEPRNPQDHVYEVHEKTEDFTADIFMRVGDRLHIRFFNGWELSEEHYNQWRKNGWLHHLGIESVRIEGPLIEQWPLPRHQTLFGNLPPTRKDAPAKTAYRLIHDFAERAFRRPTSRDELQPFFGLYDQGRRSDLDFYEAVKLAAQGILTSPAFLYLEERGQPGEPLSDYAIASRLSYFLWSSMPDEELMRLAAQGKLRDKETLVAQADRMLDDPRSEDFFNRFADEWLNVDHVGVMTPDKRLYPEFDSDLREAMKAETRRFVGELFRQNLPLANIVHSDFAMLNERLAQHYGIDGVQGEELRAVPVSPESRRGGIMTHASVLNVTSNGTLTSPVVRGVYMLETFLGYHPPQPPPDVPLIEPDIRGATTIREQLDKHREISSCANCHKKIDPIGFAFESFDVLGGWRDRYRVIESQQAEEGDRSQPPYSHGPAVESDATMPGIGAFANVDELKSLLLSDSTFPRIEKAFTEKLLAYSIGRDVQFADEQALEDIIRQYRQRNPGARSLVHHIITSQPFLTH